VAQFKVFPEFTDEKRFHYDSQTLQAAQNRNHGCFSAGSKHSLHAMVLVGTRTDQAGKRHFLLQNWWAKKQFVDVDIDYMLHCKGKIYFVTTRQTHIPSKYVTQDAHYGETTECPTNS
jgi:hypothetical protein